MYLIEFAVILLFTAADVTKVNKVLLCGCLPPFVFDYIVCKNRDEAVLRWRGSS
jgi:hypothetical protein